MTWGARGGGAPSRCALRRLDAAASPTPERSAGLPKKLLWFRGKTRGRAGATEKKFSVAPGPPRFFSRCEMALQAPSLYEVLGVPRDASSVVIRKAYLNEALALHPDKDSGDERAANERFGALRRAYGILADSSKRRAYDASGLVDDGPSTKDEECIGTSEALLPGTGFLFSCTLLGGTRPEVGALRAHETWLGSMVHENASGTGSNGYVLLELYEEIHLGGLLLFIASARQCEDGNRMERIQTDIRNAARSTCTGYKSTTIDALRKNLARTDPDAPIEATGKQTHGRVLVCADQEGVRELWLSVTTDCAHYRLIRRAGYRIDELHGYITRLAEGATPKLQEMVRKIAQERGMALLGTPAELSLLDFSGARTNPFMIKCGKRGREDELEEEAGSSALHERLLLKVENLRHALSLAEEELRRASNPHVEPASGGASSSASPPLMLCVADGLLPPTAPSANAALAADIPAHNKAAQIAVEADPENMTHLPRPGKAAGCQKELGALDPDLKAAIERSITKGLQVKRMTAGAQRLKNVLETHPSATDPSASEAETPSLLQTKLDACQLLNAAYERTIAVFANEVVTLQIVQTRWDAYLNGKAARLEASRTRRGAMVPPSVAKLINQTADSLARRLCDMAKEATQPAARQQRGELSKGLEVTHLIAAPAFELAADTASHKHDAQALTELKLYHGAYTTGVISTPAKGATYQVALEIELGATPAEVDLVHLPSAASRQVLRDQLHAQRLERIYGIELLAATDPIAGYAFDLGAEREASPPADRWAPTDPLRVLGPIGEADLAALQLCRSGAQTATSVVCLSGMALVDQQGVCHLQVSAAPTDDAAESAAVLERQRILGEMEALQEQAAQISSQSTSKKEYEDRVQPLQAQHSTLTGQYKKTYEGVAKLAPALIAQHLFNATTAAATRATSDLGDKKGGVLDETKTELPLFVVLLMYCHSVQTATQLATKVSASGLRLRMLIVSTTGQWPGSETCHVLQAVLDNVDPTGDPDCSALEKFVKDALKRDYDTATLHSLTQGHGDGATAEESWEGLLDFTLASS